MKIIVQGGVWHLKNSVSATNGAHKSNHGKITSLAPPEQLLNGAKIAVREGNEGNEGDENGRAKIAGTAGRPEPKSSEIQNQRSHPSLPYSHHTPKPKSRVQP